MKRLTSNYIPAIVFSRIRICFSRRNYDRILPLNGNQPTLSKFRIQDNDIPQIFEALKTATMITHLDLR